MSTTMKNSHPTERERGWALSWTHSLHFVFSKSNLANIVWHMSIERLLEMFTHSVKLFQFEFSALLPMNETTRYTKLMVRQTDACYTHANFIESCGRTRYRQTTYGCSWQPITNIPSATDGHNFLSHTFCQIKQGPKQQQQSLPSAQIACDGHYHKCTRIIIIIADRREHTHANGHATISFGFF